MIILETGSVWEIIAPQFAEFLEESIKNQGIVVVFHQIHQLIVNVKQFVGIIPKSWLAETNEKWADPLLKVVGSRKNV